MQVNVPEELLSSKSGEKAEVEEPKQLGIGALFQRANVRRNSLVLFTNWALVSLGYYGISMSSGSLNDNIFISYFLLSLIGTFGPGVRLIMSSSLTICNVFQRSRPTSSACLPSITLAGSPYLPRPCL